MAQPKPEDNAAFNQVLKLLNKLTPEEQEQVVEELKLQWLRRELAKAEESVDRGAMTTGKEIFRQMRERNANFRNKGDR